ncbi:MAG: alpha/beta hydrolase [Acidobacteria bacterium]|nr:alpha/beta hydrolase [Acidobacteriota bacterium]
MTPVHYDEFGLFGENVAEHGLAVDRIPEVARVAVPLDGGRSLSALCWGTGEPRAVLVHGGGQNAHTWDTVALALGVPIVAPDLPGHGHSDWRDDATYEIEAMADDLAAAVSRLAPSAGVVVGMSLGGLTSLALAARHPGLVRRLLLVDITPGVTAAKAKIVTDFINGPQTFPSFDDLLARTVAHHPTRSEASLRRGILHNARPLDDGSWQWRYDRRARQHDGAPRSPERLWDAVGSLQCPVTLVRGALSPVVDDDDVAELSRRNPSARTVVVEGAGHSIQGDRPIELADIIRRDLEG